MKLEEFMTTNIKYIDADRSVYGAIEKMVDRRIRSLVVRFPGKETEHGVITARDIVFRVLAKGIDPKDIKVSEIASKPLICVDSSMTLDDVTRIMEEHNVSRSFVCDREKIIGVISLLDLMAATLIIRARGDYVN
jgi:CBS domain-containing protein